MHRPPELNVDALMPEQRKVYDAIMAGPRGHVVGPLRVWLQSAELADRAQALGAFCRFGSSLPPRLSELAIITIGAYWQAGFEFWAHGPMAIKAGIDAAAVEAIRKGDTPDLIKSDEQAVYEFARELLHTRSVSGRDLPARRRGTRPERCRRSHRHPRLLRADLHDHQGLPRAGAARRERAFR